VAELEEVRGSEAWSLGAKALIELAKPRGGEWLYNTSQI
jgi:hypothetical protein